MDTASNESRRSEEPAAAELLSRAQAGSPGQRIREARQQAGLSVGEFATQLRLTVSTLQALESDDFLTLKESVYVRGYYRKCAKLLPLNEKELIATYDRMAVPKSGVAAAPSKLLLATSESEGRDPRSRLRWLGIAVLVIAGLAVIALMYLRHDRGMAEPAAEAQATGAATPAAEAAPAKAVEAAPLAAPQTTPANAAAPSASQAAAPLPQPTSSPAQALAPAQPEPAKPDSGTPVTTGSSAPANPIAAVPAGAAPSAAPGSDAVLALDFREQSWAEVFDASGKRLLSGMMKAGAHEALVGRPPYSVFLGNAPKVDVSFSGQHVDLSGRVRDNATARFQIPLN